MNTRSRSGGKRAEAAEDLRGRLLDAAEALLAERQPGAITSRDIARTAGVSDGVLYNHFEDKHALLLHALLRRFERLMATFAAHERPAGQGSTREAVGVIVRHAYALQVEALPMLANLVGDPPLFQRFLHEIHRPPLGSHAFARPIRDALAAEQALGRLGAFDPDAATDLILGAVLMQGLIDVLGHRPSDERDRHLDGIVETILGGLAAAGQPTKESR